MTRSALRAAVRLVPGDAALGLSGAGTRVILIGTGTHAAESGLPAVPAVRTTLADLRRVLTERCGLRDGNVTVVEDPASLEEIGLALAEQAEQADEVLLVYYVGHGLVSVGGELYLATRVTDPRPSRLSYTALAYAAVRDSVLESTARSKVVILDCCFSGRALTPLAGTGDGLVATDLARVYGGYVLTSAAREELALAPEGAVHTAFTGELLRLLEAGDPDGPAMLTLSYVYRYLSDALPARGFPRPRRRASEWIDDLVLVPNPAPRRVLDAPTDLPAEDVCPYRGLAAFEQDDARWFFGRERLTTELLGRLAGRLEQAGPLLVVGASGAGKSSLLRAGLLSALSAGTLLVPGSRTWPRLLFTPTADPIGALAAQVAQLADREPGPVREQLSVAPAGLGDIVRAALQNRVEGVTIGGTRAVIVVDQFEELFTHCENESEREVFIRALCAAAGADGPAEAEPAALVVLGVRADFYDRCAGYSPLLPALEDGQVVLGPMRTAEMRDAIERPARAAGLTLEPGLVETLLRDLDTDPDGASNNGHPGVRDPGALPLLSHALEATWEKRDQDSRILTKDGYAAIGGIRKAVATTAERTFEHLGEREQQAARRLLLRLVQVGNNIADARLSVDRDALVGQAPDPPAAATALDALTRARLITLRQDTAEITHDALLRAWPRLRAWLDADRAGLYTHQQLTEAALVWDRDGRPNKALYPPTKLAVADEWAQGHQDELGLLERGFLAASRELQERQERARSRRFTQLSVGMVVLLIISLAGAIFYATQPPAARDTPAGLARAATLSGNIGVITRATFSPDGSLLAIAGDDSTVQLWNVSDPLRPRLTFTGPSESVVSVAFSPDGARLATAGEDGTVRLRDVATGAVTTLTGHAEAVTSTSFSPDGALLATAGEDGTVRLWDARGGTAVAALTGHTAAVTSTSFSPGGALLATAGEDGTVRLWDVTDPTRPVGVADPLTGHDGRIYAVDFSPDGGLLATASYDRTARLWDVSDLARPAPVGSPLTGHDNAVVSARFGPDGRNLATASIDGVVRIWNVNDPTRPTPVGPPLTGHNGTAVAEFSPDGRTLATVDESGTNVILWNLP